MIAILKGQKTETLVVTKMENAIANVTSMEINAMNAMLNTLDFQHVMVGFLMHMIP